MIAAICTATSPGVLRIAPPGFAIFVVMVYCCRHTACARLIVLAKGYLPLAQSITGHRTLSELQCYLHATSERRHVIADAYESHAHEMNIGPSYLQVGS
jgi:hypothetical protein